MVTLYSLKKKQGMISAFSTSNREGLTVQRIANNLILSGHKLCILILLTIFNVPSDQESSPFLTKNYVYDEMTIDLK